MRRSFPWRFTYFGYNRRNGRIKIGASKRPFARMWMLGLRPLGLLPCAGSFKKNWEIGLHNKFDDLRTRGEYFKDCERIRRFILKSGAHANLFEYHAKFLPESKPYQSVAMSKLYNESMEWMAELVRRQAETK